ARVRNARIPFKGHIGPDELLQITKRCKVSQGRGINIGAAEAGDQTLHNLFLVGRNKIVGGLSAIGSAGAVGANLHRRSTKIIGRCLRMSLIAALGRELPFVDEAGFSGCIVNDKESKARWLAIWPGGSCAIRN